MALRELMEAIAETCRDIPNLNASAEMTGSITPPYLMIGVPPIDSYRATFGRGKLMIEDWPLYLFTSAKTDWVGQLEHADYVDWKGAKSIPLALEANPTLGGLAVDLQVNGSRPLGVEEVGLIGYYGGLITITVEVVGT